MLKAFDPRWRGISWEQAVVAANSPVARLLEKALAGNNLTFEEGIVLSAAEDNDLLAIVKVADELRRQAVGECITYVVNRNLNFTNVCIVGCAFCGFSRGPNSPDAYFHSTETLVAKCVEAVERGATEVCIQGGLPRDLDGYYYVNLLRAIKSRLPALHIHAYSPMEIAYGVEKTGMSLRDYLLMLKAAGLEPEQADGAALGRDHSHRSRARHSVYLHNDVRPRGTARTLGSAFVFIARDPKRHTRIHRIRSAGIHSFANTAVPIRPRPSGQLPPGRFVGACPRAPALERLHSEYPSLMGQARIRRRTRLPGSRSK